MISLRVHEAILTTTVGGKVASFRFKLQHMNRASITSYLLANARCVAVSRLMTVLSTINGSVGSSTEGS